MSYASFIEAKSHLPAGMGFKPTFMPDFLYDFQESLTEWAIETGRSAMFADCGMGKTPMQLVWAQNVIEKTVKPVLILAPLAVSQQTIEEAEKFDIDAVRSMDGSMPSSPKIITTNYERLHYFNADDFAGVVCDESSIMKNFDGVRKGQITEFMKKVPYRLLCTATAAPNDYIELGTSSEALGRMGYMDMLSQFFKNDQDSISPAFFKAQWRFKRHAENDFWRWVCSWARSCRRPSDLGFDNRDFMLPELREIESIVESPVAFGEMFAKPSLSLNEQRQENRDTIESRCSMAAEKLTGCPSAIAWCHLNAEADLLAKLIPGAVQVKGPDSDERKEEVFTAFRKGQIPALVTKPRIAAFGMNWQHCHSMSYFPTHSFEQYYQAVRRCWRFGQTHRVDVHVVTSEAQTGTLRNLQKKERACVEMFERIVTHMQDALKIIPLNQFSKAQEMPSWL